MCRNITLAAFAALVLMMTTFSVASAADKSYISGADGSLVAKTTKYKAKRTVPISGVLKLSHAFLPGVPTEGKVTFKFWNVPISVREKGVLKRKKAFDLFNRALLQPGLVTQVSSCRPPEGTPDTNGYEGLCDKQKFQPGSYEPGLPAYDERWKKASFDVAQPYFDWSYNSTPLKRKTLKRNRSVTYKVRVTFPRCVGLDTSWAASSRLAGVNWPCQPGSLVVGTTYKLKGNKGWIGQGYMSFRSRGDSMYIYPPSPTP